MNNVAMFVVTGLAMTIVVGILAGLGIAETFRLEGWKKVITTVILALAIGFGISGVITLDKISEEQYFNNGYCECGGEWELIDIEKSSRIDANTFYFYQCDECGDTFSTHIHFKK